MNYLRSVLHRQPSSDTHPGLDAQPDSDKLLGSDKKPSLDAESGSDAQPDLDVQGCSNLPLKLHVLVYSFAACQRRTTLFANYT